MSTFIQTTFRTPSDKVGLQLCMTKTDLRTGLTDELSMLFENPEDAKKLANFLRD